MRLQLHATAVAAALIAASCSGPQDPSLASNPNVPGATGRTVVIGSHSSMAGSNRVHLDWSDPSTNVGNRD